MSFSVWEPGVLPVCGTLGGSTALAATGFLGSSELCGSAPLLCVSAGNSPGAVVCLPAPTPDLDVAEVGTLPECPSALPSS
ncbi:hypothetical protein Kpho01_75060 [Kitasatospora phosalacinea]|uniref:Uncharacterized protein n=1 Tax=Kitasatospora phosalacinea TaxID=2065 RepID=A0A9W6PQX5_9ACTN|nr:hypothetical protein Kpho01_75060 [Kitasatospora phosalacinea]